ncbi:HdeD family acid-resistance protein [Actinocorallia longicatena]|uniref:DUF308 domain-containing protein n=1 Tax=Actinocorallia longicatena TaxID=111803 RepID=A0ABP6Q934_9ACTN
MSAATDPYLSTVPRDPAAARAAGWRLSATEGLVTAFIGIAIAFLPEATIAVVAGLFALQLLARGGLRVAQGAVSAVPARVRLVHGALGAASLILGVLVLAHPPESVVVLSVLIGLYWLIGGVAQLLTGEDLVPVMFSLLGAVLLLTVPVVSLAFLASACGICLSVWGLATATAAFLRGASTRFPRRG